MDKGSEDSTIRSKQAFGQAVFYVQNAGGHFWRVHGADFDCEKEIKSQPDAVAEMCISHKSADESSGLFRFDICFTVGYNSHNRGLGKQTSNPEFYGSDSMKTNRNTLYIIVETGLMAALVFAGNYLSIPIPNGGLMTRIHLGNSMCLLAGLLFGGIEGGLASGIGAALYDMLTPAYIASAPYTFFSKFAMGFTAGVLRKKGSGTRGAVIGAAVAGQIVYIILYLAKTFVSQLLLGEPVNVALIKVGTNAVTSTVNGILAVVISVPLYFALSAALRKTPFAKDIAGHQV